MQVFPWQTIIRAMLKIGAGWFLSRGILIDDSSMEIYSAALAAIIATLWGWWEKRQLQKKLGRLQETRDSQVSI